MVYPILIHVYTMLCIYHSPHINRCIYLGHRLSVLICTHAATMPRLRPSRAAALATHALAPAVLCRQLGSTFVLCRHHHHRDPPQAAPALTPSGATAPAPAVRCRWCRRGESPSFAAAQGAPYVCRRHLKSSAQAASRRSWFQKKPDC